MNRSSKIQKNVHVFPYLNGWGIFDENSEKLSMMTDKEDALYAAEGITDYNKEDIKIYTTEPNIFETIL